jgi:LacI family transcriptional regulator
LLAEHLIKLGSRRLAFVAQPHMAPTINARIAGVREALAAHHLEDGPDWVKIGNPEELKFVRSLIGGRRWDAVVCANDWIAAQLLRMFEKDNVRVPRDVRLVGFDDAKYATLLGVSLTTMRQPCREIAITAFRAMLERMADPTLPARSLLLTPQLMVRESCGAYLPRSKTA